MLGYAGYFRYPVKLGSRFFQILKLDISVSVGCSPHVVKPVISFAPCLKYPAYPTMLFVVFSGKVRLNILHPSVKKIELFHR